MNSLKKIAAALITSLVLAGTAHTADLPVATDRLPDELLGCWKWNDTKLDKLDSIYNRNRASAADCKGFGNITSGGYFKYQSQRFFLETVNELSTLCCDFDRHDHRAFRPGSA